ncbi:metallophosphoesterase family protein [Melittangium boletus]|uniref:Calcineurin-like phosphoesterase domain-containing protein n=1 Tax=Melittangium boletus DSM 14713 TaxID=1294270 RepID=A0A250IL48_9BACT|nr:metallophosphoesterase [Melittangium boletus]ATB32464.1 hypothetical protein MEBOL_005944 [Melittangium boletus DSM 14713]
MARLGWLHLSDLHLGIHGSRLLQPEYREALHQDLRGLHARAGPWSLVLISGDLTLTGSPREFELLNSALDSLWTLLRELGSEPCLLVVPGDHDIRRDPNPRLPDLGSRYRALEARKAFRAESPGQVERTVWKGFAAFNDWFSTWRHMHPSSQLTSFRPGLLPGDFAATVASEGVTVGVIGLNSSFRSSARDGLEGMNEIDVEQVEAATGQDLRAWARPHDALLLLTHHPPSKLRDALLTELGERLAFPGRPLLHLCGDRLTEGGSLLGVPPRPWSRSLHASDLFSELPRSSHAPGSGYLAGQLQLTGMGGRLELFPRSTFMTEDGTLVLEPDTRTLSGDRESIEIPWSELLQERPSSVSPSAPEAPAPRPTRPEPPSPDSPIRILHLSDLHVEAGQDPHNLLQPLAADLRGKPPRGLGVERLDHLVISGDLTQKASPQEFEKARAFVSELLEEFGLTPRQCIIVPGNHDLDWSAQVYAERFKNFSDFFYQPLFQRAYPLPPEEQCLSFFFRESRIQFLALNSAWEIDKHFTERSSIHEGALSRGLRAADRELGRESNVLRMAVWHHPITGNEKIKDDAFTSRLSQADVRVCLHGHVHEIRADLLDPTHPWRSMHVIGAGSFGAPYRDRPESVPRLYNLLEVERELHRLRVHVRSRPKQGGAWGPEPQWPNARTGEIRPYYDVTLS